MIQDSIEVKIPQLAAILGCAQAEREMHQDIAIDLEMFIDTKRASETGELSDCLDYVRILGELRFIMGHARYYLIETAANDLAKFLLSPRVSHLDQVSPSAIKLKITKPHALSGFAVPSLKITRSFNDLKYSPVQKKKFGMQRIIIDSCDVRITKIALIPGANISKVAGSSIMALSAGLLFEKEDKVLSKGDVLKEGISGRVINTTEVEQVVLVLHSKDHLNAVSKLSSDHKNESNFNYFEPVINQYVERAFS